MPLHKHSRTAATCDNIDDTCPDGCHPDHGVGRLIDRPSLGFYRLRHVLSKGPVVIPFQFVLLCSSQESIGVRLGGRVDSDQGGMSAVLLYQWFKGL